MNKMFEHKSLLIWFGVVLVVFSVGMRLFPHVPNFAPIAALSLFAGVYFNKRWSLTVPLIAMLASDFFLGFYDWRLMLVVYSSFLAIVVGGWFVKKHKSFFSGTLGILGGSVLFFLTTNFAVWEYGTWYPHTLNGLLLSYTAALPFFKNSLTSNLFYSGLFFGSFIMAKDYSAAWFLSRNALLVKNIVKT